MKPRIDVGGRQGRDERDSREPPDMMRDGPLLAGLGVIVWLCVAALVFTAWRIFA